MPYFPLVVQPRHPQLAGLAGAVGFVSGSSALVGALLTPLAGALGDRFGFPKLLTLRLTTAAGAPN